MKKQSKDFDEFKNDFEDVNKSENENQNSEGSEGIGRVRLPKGREVIGIIEQRLGGNRMNISCTDGKTRNCRVPGRLRRRLWLRPNDVVIIEPWELDDTKGDVLFKYRPVQVKWLKKKGHLEKEQMEF